MTLSSPARSATSPRFLDPPDKAAATACNLLKIHRATAAITAGHPASPGRSAPNQLAQSISKPPAGRPRRTRICDRLYDIEIRKVLCSTKCHRVAQRPPRRAVKARGHFPTEQAALECLYLVTRSLDPTGQGKARWAMRWKSALNALAITFGDRFPAAETY